MKNFNDFLNEANPPQPTGTVQDRSLEGFRSILDSLMMQS